MKTFKFYLEASNHFLNSPNYSQLDSEQREYYHFASIMLSWCCLESFINTIAESLSCGTRLKPHEKAFLMEQSLEVSDKGEFQKRKIKPSTTKKILFILSRFSKIGVKDFRKKKIWKDLKGFEDLRNRIIHHKEKTGVKISLKKAIECRDLVIDVIDFFNRDVLKVK